MIHINDDGMFAIEMTLRSCGNDTYATHGKTVSYLIKNLLDLTDMLLITYLDEDQLAQQFLESGLTSYDSF